MLSILAKLCLYYCLHYWPISVQYIMCVLYGVWNCCEGSIYLSKGRPPPLDLPLLMPESYHLFSVKQLLQITSASCCTPVYVSFCHCPGGAETYSATPLEFYEIWTNILITWTMWQRWYLRSWCIPGFWWWFNFWVKAWEEIRNAQYFVNYIWKSYLSFWEKTIVRAVSLR